MTTQPTYEQTVLPHLDSVYRAALAVSGNPATADDLTQTTMLKALERFETFRPGSNPKAWLLRIMRNTWIDRLRHRKVVGPEVQADETLLAGEEAVEPTAWTDAADLIDNFADEEVIHALQELPPDQRLALYLSDVEQLKHEEIGEIMDVAVGTIKSRTSRARAALRDRLYQHALDLGIVGRRG